MRIFAPDFSENFRCLGGVCPDNCCRQGWQIDIDEAHLAQYRALPGELGERVRAAITQDGLKMERGACALLDEDGLCPIVKALGEDGLCRICHTHPRFIEQYGGVREIHYSLSCPEAARLSLARSEPIRFTETVTDEPITEPNEIDPDEYLALMQLRKFAIQLMQQRRIPIRDRLALLISFSVKVQRLLDGKRYGSIKPLCRLYKSADYRRRILTRYRRMRKRGTSFLPDITLLRTPDALTEEFPRLLQKAVFTRNESTPFDRENEVKLEHLTVLWLAHYIPKAVNDGNAATKIRFAAYLTLCARRLCVCTGEEIAHISGLLAKEIEHNSETVSLFYKTFENPFWAKHMIAQLEE